MKKVEIKATTGSKEKGSFKEVSGEATQYESVSEALKALKEEATLKLINSQSKTNALDALRKSARPKAELSISRLVGKLPSEGKGQVELILKRYGLRKAA